ncbi:MAG TPA: MerR family transcriptional regulator [Solirubrobacteraceae bacterium]|nr:MerR family transcriptional regulator [Solirubrobacteraceae bacterium]
MRYLKTTEAAALLDVGPSTLRAWERRFGFPKPQRSHGGHRHYTHGEVAALRDALQEGLSISAAVMRARAGLAADADSLVRALLAYDRERADRAIETALALRSVEGSVEEVLLPSLDEIVSRHGTDSAAWAFSAWWADDWLRRAARLAPPPNTQLSILLGHALRDELDLDAPCIRALELFCLRAGVRVLSLPARVLCGIGDAASVHRPDVVVLAGGQVDDATVARWAHVIGRSVGPLPLALYRPSSPRISGTVLPRRPAEAQLRLLELADRAVPAAVVRLARTG